MVGALLRANSETAMLELGTARGTGALAGVP